MTERRNIGIFAHVDAGKTSTTEQLLYHAGVLRTRGKVDDGTAATDDLDVERARGISVRSQPVRFSWRGVRIQLIDTPGHTDFAGEAERAMWALDGAVLMLSAAEGVQSYTILLAQYLESAGLPYILFINKSDYPEADIHGIVQDLRERLGIRCVLMTNDDEVLECAAELSDELMEAYFAGELKPDAARRAIQASARQNRIHPVYTGSALRDIGITELLDAMVDCLPDASGDGNGALSGIVFGIEHDRAMGRGAHVRLFSGSMRARESVILRGKGECKVTQIRNLGIGSEKFESEQATAGDVVTVFGLSGCAVGDVIGTEDLFPRPIRPGELQMPLMMVRAEPEDPGKLTELREALTVLTEENPLLDLSWDRVSRQLHIRIMGMIQTEVLKDTLLSRFGIKAELLEPTVIYKETPKTVSEGFYAYTMPKPCWAILRFRIEPLPRGSGIMYEDIVPPARMSVRYRKQVVQTLPRALRQGMLGWEVTDAKITLIDGQDHQWHTHPLDFTLCTPIAIMDGIKNAGSQLLEPMVHATFSVPQHLSGRILSDIALMRGVAGESRAVGQLMSIEAEIPAAEMLEYPVKFASLTGGRGVLVTKFAGYKECPMEYGRTAEYRGVHPLDTARYILAMRSALEVEDLR